MSDDLLGELAELSADVRALAQAALARGERWDAGGVLPPSPTEAAAVGGSRAAQTPMVAPPPKPAAAEPKVVEVSRRWSAMAQASRAQDDARIDSLEEIREDLGDCRRCGLCTTRRNIAFGVGDPRADLMLIGEGPGEQEDRQGVPFVGPAGELLDKMLKTVLNLDRDEVYIANVVKCRPPNNRNPLPDEVTACLPFLERQIAAVQPKLILVLGGVAYKALMNTTQGITRARGSWTELGGVPALPTFHPAYLLRKPQDKRLSFNDLKTCLKRYEELGGRRRGPAPSWP